MRIDRSVWVFVSLLILNSCGGQTTFDLLAAKFAEGDRTPPELLSVEAEAGATQITLTFNEGVQAATGINLVNAFEYINTNGTAASAITGVLENNGADGNLILETDVGIQTVDNQDQIRIKAGALTDAAGNEIAGTARNITLTFLPPQILSAETMDADGNFQIDHLRITFSVDVIDATFPGFVEDGTGFPQTTWLVNGISDSVFLTHGAAAPESDTPDDAVIYLRIYESGRYDTGATPDLTTTVSPGLLDFDPTPLSQITSDTVSETDGVAPSLVQPAGLAGSSELQLIFSEPVFTQSGGSFTAGSFSYTDGNAAGAGAITGVIDGDGSRGLVRLQTDTGVAFTDAADTFSLPADLVFDAAGLSAAAVINRGVYTGVRQLTVGGFHTCVLFWAGNVRCWGLGDDGRLGYNSTNNVGDGIGPSIATTGDVPIGGNAIYIDAGQHHTCVVLDNGNVRCWGQNGFGQLGYGHPNNVGDGIGDSIIAAGNVPVGGTATQVALGSTHTCVLLDTGDVRCWGFADSTAVGVLGPLAAGTYGDDGGEMPTATVPIGGTAVAISAGDQFSCALMTGNTLRCWGYNFAGQLGTGGTTNISDAGDFPPADINAGDSVSEVATSFSGTICARTGSANPTCWGYGLYGVLGIGSDDNLGDDGGEMPPATINIGGTIQSIDVGNGGACAVLTSNTVRCWGISNLHGYGIVAYGEIGDDPGEIPPPDGTGADVDIGKPVAQVAMGNLHSCVLLTDGNVRCWGDGTGGKLGYNSTTDYGDTPGNPPSGAGDVPLY